METLIAIIQNSDDSFFSVLVLDENGHTQGYNLMVFNEDTVKHNSEVA